MGRSKVLILEGDEARKEDFRAAVASLGEEFEVVIWQDAAAMMAECEQHFEGACLISLEHDLPPIAGAQRSVVSGLEVSDFLAHFARVCPVIIHSGNAERAWAMQNELRFTGWTAERVAPAAGAWIQNRWRAKARALIEGARNDPVVHNRPPDHPERIGRALTSLIGLSVGDAFGASFGEGRVPKAARQRMATRTVAPPPWPVTDDTIMAMSLVETLDRSGQVHQEILAARFADRHQKEPKRGYSRHTARILRRIKAGVPWIEAVRPRLLDSGSMDSGAAMRVAPLGAYFLDDFCRAAAEAEASAEVTHHDPEAKAGAVAVALAAAWAAANRDKLGFGAGLELLAFCAEEMPSGLTQKGLERARRISFGAPPELTARTLGNGSKFTAPDTIPFALWCAARHLDDYREALWTTVKGLGDCDTNCAIVGGIVILTAALRTVPDEWLRHRERLPLDE